MLATPFKRVSLSLEPLESRTNPAPLSDGLFAVGAAPGAAPVVTLHDAQGNTVATVAAMDHTPGSPGFFPGGVTAALGDITGDGVPDVVVAAGRGGGPRVQVFDGTTLAEVRSFFAFEERFAGGVNVAVGDVTGDGRADIVTAAGPGGGPHVKVFDGKTNAERLSFYAYAEAFTGGVSVAVSGRGNGTLVTGAGPGGGPHVKTFGWETQTVRVSPTVTQTTRTGRYIETSSFYAFDESFTGGVNVAYGFTAGDPIITTPPVFAGGGVIGGEVNLSGGRPITVSPTNPAVLAVIASQASGGSQVVVMPTGKAKTTFAPFDTFTGGASVALRDLTGDGVDDWIVGAGPGGGPHVKAFDGRTLTTPLADFMARPLDFTGGVPVG